jgi:hypothetical protein
MSLERSFGVAQPLQDDPTALIIGLPAARTANIVANNAPSGSEHSDAIISVPLVQNIRQVSHLFVARHAVWIAGALLLLVALALLCVRVMTNLWNAPISCHSFIVPFRGGDSHKAYRAGAPEHIDRGLLTGQLCLSGGFF